MCIGLCSCSSKYDKHVSNVEEYITKIQENEDVIIEVEKSYNYLDSEMKFINELKKDIAKRDCENAFWRISHEYKNIESEDDKVKFLQYIRSRISQETYNRFSDYLEEGSIHTDILNLYETQE